MAQGARIIIDSGAYCAGFRKRVRMGYTRCVPQDGQHALLGTPARTPGGTMSQSVQRYRGLVALKFVLYVLAVVSLLIGAGTLVSASGFQNTISGPGLGSILNAALGGAIASAVIAGGAVVAALCALLSLLLFASGKMIGFLLNMALRVQYLEQAAAQESQPSDTNPS
jgi:hypothetical protein